MSRKSGVGMLLLLAGLLAAGCSPQTEDVPKLPARTYTNPISLPDEWGEYGLGDPFVFSYNGYYYLYVSTRDTDAGVKVWRSADLADWKYEGLCTEDPLTTGAYAPEVRYWNGKFYMYTSPAGQGHYVLESDSPTGPFKVATDNFGRTIDGSTFVDDDGQWYFYYAGPNGIQAAPMSDPLTVAPEEDQTGAYMGGWTEGPTVFKRNGKYYMTYTGNHVFSAGYRVDAAVSDAPLQGFAGFGDNPVLLRSDGATVGLGHNSVVTGPDLDTQYMIYHNLEGHGVVGPLRHMNMDRIVWNGDGFRVWGPTSDAQPAPELPAFADRFERNDLGKDWKTAGDGSWSVNAKDGLSVDAAGKEGRSMLLGKTETPSAYTAEFHVRLDGGAGKAGAVFSYENDKNYGITMLDAQAGQLTAEVREGGKVAVTESAKLPGDLDISQLQTLRLEVSGKTVRIYVEGMHLLDLALKDDAGAGKIGYAAESAKARFGYVAFSGSVGGSGVRHAYAPLPGFVNAADDEAGEAIKLGIAQAGAEGAVVKNLGAGKKLSYLVSVPKSGTYNFHFRIAPGSDGVKFRLKDGDSEVIPAIEAPAGKAGEWVTVSAVGSKLDAGYQRLTLEVDKGSMDFAKMETAAYAPVTAVKDDFEDKNDFGWTRYEGGWSVKQGQLRASSLQPAKTVIGDYGWTDYSVEADLTVPEDGGQTGLLVRVANPANGMDQNQNRDDFLQGYFVYVDAKGIHLVKHDYDTVPLADAAFATPQPGEMMHLKVLAEGSRLTVYAGDGGKPVLEYEDKSGRAFLQGKAGLKSVGTASRFDKVRIEPAGGKP